MSPQAEELISIYNLVDSFAIKIKEIDKKYQEFERESEAKRHEIDVSQKTTTQA